MFSFVSKSVITIAACCFTSSISAQPAAVPENRVANILVSGEADKQTIKMLFDTSALPVLQQGKAGDRKYYILAVTPDGRTLVYSAGVWAFYVGGPLPNTQQAVPTYSLYADPAPETLVLDMDVRGLTGVAFYGGILTTPGTLWFNYAGSIRPSRELSAVSFPFYAGSWTVSRTKDPITDGVSCQVYTLPLTSDSRYRVFFGWVKSARTESSNLTSFLQGVSGAYLFSAHGNNSQFRIDNGTAMPINRNSGGAFYYDTNLSKVAGPQLLYYNYSPTIETMSNGSILNYRFVSQAGSTSYTVAVPLSQFASAVNAFDYCVSTQ